MKKRSRTSILLISLVTLVILFFAYQHLHKGSHTNQTQSTPSEIKKEPTTPNMRVPIDYQKSSQTIPYPNIANTPDVWVKVRIKKNRVYIMSGQKVIYTMYTSAGRLQKNQKTGKVTSLTPTGTFYLEPEKGLHFYNPRFKDGAKFYSSFKDHGVYLFHTVPTDINGDYIIKEAQKLGKEPASAGCVRLSIPDAKWFYHNMPVGTKVVITLN
ncbi:L,D-transpeptidase [Ligilactobacillus ceti]|nr:L,D-transpeptidase [Ligilactobacillus ceti]